MDLFNIPLCSLSVNDSGKRTFAGNPMINWICSKLLLISSLCGFGITGFGKNVRSAN